MPEIIIYSTTTCPYCHAAKSLLDSAGHTYREIDLTGDDNARLELTGRTQHRTVPQIFVNEEFIGGYNELAALIKAGQLRRPSLAA